jgi:hypothetical protein
MSEEVPQGPRPPQEKSLGWVGFVVFGVPIIIVIILAALKVI